MAITPALRWVRGLKTGGWIAGTIVTKRKVVAPSVAKKGCVAGATTPRMVIGQGGNSIEILEVWIIFWYF